MNKIKVGSIISWEGLETFIGIVLEVYEVHLNAYWFTLKVKQTAPIKYCQVIVP